MIELTSANILDAGCFFAKAANNKYYLQSYGSLNCQDSNSILCSHWFLDEIPVSVEWMNTSTIVNLYCSTDNITSAPLISFICNCPSTKSIDFNTVLIIYTRDKTSPTLTPVEFKKNILIAVLICVALFVTAIILVLVALYFRRRIWYTRI